jgi:small multidrug resistance pump
MRVWLPLLLAILAEVVATTALARSDGFGRPGPALLAVAGYAAAFYLLSFPLRVLPTGVV